MEFTKVQQEQTRIFNEVQKGITPEMMQYFINGRRVSRDKFYSFESESEGYSNSLTTKTRAGNWRHSCSRNHSQD